MFMQKNELQEVLRHFQLVGTFDRFEEITSGNVNSTYHVFYQTPQGEQQLTLQNINHYVFKDPQAVMENIERVTCHLHRRLCEKGLDPMRRVLHTVSTLENTPLYVDGENYWRMFYYIDGATAYNSVVKPEHFYETGCAFGAFQRDLCDFPIAQLHDTLPGFHDTPARYRVFEQAVAEDRAGRVAELSREIAFLRARQKMMGSIVERLQDGTLPLRVTHNDTKINNVLIDDCTDEAICVIDLDTVMPGSSLYDYGDAIRYGANTGAEDEQDVTKISLDLEMYTRFTQGFLSRVNGFLSPEEILLLPLGVKVITCELAMRFLTDYIEGDRYFKVRYPGHNLVRAHAQMRLLEDVEAKADCMQQLIVRCTQEV